MTSWVKWRDITLMGGHLSDLALGDVRGWLDSPDMRMSDSDRPGRHGQRPGSLFAAGRIVEADFEVLAQGVAGLAVLTALRRAVAPTEDPVEESLEIWRGTPDPLMAWARLVKWSIPTDQQFSLGRRRGTLQWKATDPRLYGSVARSQQCGLPTAVATGVAFPLAFPLAFGMGTSGGEMLLATSGSAAAWPVFTISGPVTAPAIVNLDSDRHLTFADGFEVLAGQQLVIDTDVRSVLIGEVSRRNEMTTADWFALPADTMVRVAFRAAAYAAARLSVTWRDAWF